MFPIKHNALLSSIKKYYVILSASAIALQSKISSNTEKSKNEELIHQNLTFIYSYVVRNEKIHPLSTKPCGPMPHSHVCECMRVCHILTLSLNKDIIHTTLF